MLSREDLEAICLRLKDPFEGSRKALEELKGHALETETDAIFYARRILDLYETVIGRINRDLDDARRTAQGLKAQYSNESDPGFSLGEVDERLSEAVSKAQSKKYEVVETLQRKLAGRSVDVRTKRHIVVLNTDSGQYGFHLDNPKRIMKDAYHVWTPFGPYYWLGGRRYHIPRISTSR